MNTNVKHIWSAVCQKAIVDSNTNNISLIEILEMININASSNIVFDEEKAFGIPFNFDIVTLWKKIEKNKLTKEEIKVIIYSPKNKELLSQNINFEIPSSKKSYRTIVKINGFPFVGDGEYIIRIHHKISNKYDIVSEIPIDITITKSANFIQK